MKTLIARRTIPAPADDVWPVLSDVGGYARYAPNIDYSKIVTGSNHGMVRECGNRDGRWTEVCSLWDPGQRYAFEVQTHAEDYPYPFRLLKGMWSVRPVSNNESQIEMIFHYEFRNRMLAVFVEPFMRHQFSRTCEELLDNWQRELV